jgi:predicted deacylase
MDLLHSSMHIISSTVSSANSNISLIYTPRPRVASTPSTSEQTCSTNAPAEWPCFKTPRSTPKTKAPVNRQIIVHNTSPGGSLRGAAMELGIPAITVEIGNPGVFQKRFVKNALLGVTNIISSLRMINDDSSLAAEEAPVICDRSYWIFTEKGGILNVLPEVNTWVRKGEVIATITSIFGQLIDKYEAPDDSIVIGKEIDPVASSGARIVHLGVMTGSFAKGKVRPRDLGSGH